MHGSRQFVRDNAFLVAAVVLPLAVVALFWLATTMPRAWVPPPAYDLIIHANRHYEQRHAGVAVDFEVRDGSVFAVVRAMPPDTYAPRPGLLLFQHDTLDVREIPFDVPADLSPGDPPRAVRIEALAGRRVVAQTRAPDGYELDTHTDRGAGIVGDLFGMGRRDRRVALVNGSRLVPISLPAAYQDPYPAVVHAIGWVIEQ